MKSPGVPESAIVEGPAPQGAGGLKSLDIHDEYNEAESRPARGGWIEMYRPPSRSTAEASRPARGGWIEMAEQAVLSLWR